MLSYSFQVQNTTCMIKIENPPTSQSVKLVGQWLDLIKSTLEANATSVDAARAVGKDEN